MRPLGIGELLDAAIKIVRRQARPLFRIVLVVVVPVQLLAIAIAAAAGGGTTQTSVFDPNTGATTTETVNTGAFTAQAVASLLGSIATLIATAALVKAVSDTWIGQTPDWRESLRAAGKRAGALIWLVILVMAVLMGGFIALVIPGIWAMVPCALAFPALIVEGCKGFKAIGRGRRLVKGRWWPTFGAIFLGYMLSAILGFMLGGLAGAVFFASGHGTGFAVGNAIASSLATFVTTPFNAAIITLAYYDLRVRKEGFDLQLLAGGDASIVNQSFFRPAAQPQHSSGQPPFWPPPPDWQPPPGWTPSPPQA